VATSVTLLQIIDKVRARGEFEDPRPTKANLIVWINDSIAAFRGRVIAADSSRYLTQSNIPVVSGTESYALPADFYDLVGVDLTDSSSNTGFVPMGRFDWHGRNMSDVSRSEKRDAEYEIRNGKIWFHPPPLWTETVRINYTPNLTALAADGDSWDSVNRWDEWVVADVCVKCAVAEAQDETGFEKARDFVEADIFPQKARADNYQPKTVVNVEPRYSQRRRWGW
jgi:hypothetical protein